MKSRLGIIILISLLLGACSSYFNQADDPNMSNFQANSSDGGKPHMKITRGSGYGLEVPYDNI